ncbi:MAG: ECF-type sigma factor [Planctomycetota bacterium]
MPKHTHDLHHRQTSTEGADDRAIRVESVLPQTYGELRALAQHRLRDFPAEQSLCPTELVHEVFVKLAAGSCESWQSRKHFIDVAAMAMRSVLVDRARARLRTKRGSGERPRPLAEDVTWIAPDDHQTVMVDELIEDLRAQDERAAQVVVLRFILSMPEHQIASVLGVTPRTVRRDWLFARTWIHGRMLATDRGG